MHRITIATSSKSPKLSPPDKPRAVLGVIPARYASTRLPGKPLASIGGKPLIQHTYESACRAKLVDHVIIATDDSRIYEKARAFGAQVMMTPSAIQTGSDRIAFIAREIPSAEIIVNIQGDEPFIAPEMINQAVEPLLFDKRVQVATLAKKIDGIEELVSPAVVKVVFDELNYAIYFSRAPIPHPRDYKSLSASLKSVSYYKHIGLYVYRRDALFRFTTWEQGALEQIEKLEQLRFIEKGVRIKVVETALESIAVDTPADLEVARAFYKAVIKKRVKQ